MRRQFVLQPMQRQVRCLMEPLRDEGAVWLQQSLAMSAHLAGRDRTRRPMALTPLHHRRNRNPEPFRNRPTAPASRNRRNDTLAKIIGKRSGHQMLASNPASILNHNSHQSGIKSDSAKRGNALGTPASHFRSGPENG